MSLDTHRAVNGAGLRVIRAIGQGGSYSAAAEALGLSQAAISQMTRRLEQRTGTPLVERFGPRVRLTEAGQVLARHADAVLAALAVAEAEIAAITGLQAGHVRVAAAPATTGVIVAEALADVHRRFPHLVLSFSEAPVSATRLALAAGTCDVAVGYREAQVASDARPGCAREPCEVSTSHLLDDDIRLVVARDHPLATSGHVTVAALAGETWITGCGPGRDEVVRLLARNGFDPSIAYQTDDTALVLALVGAGLGVALMPGLALGRATSRATSAVTAISIDPPVRREVVAMTTPDLLRVPAVAQVIEAMQAAATRLTQNGA